MCYPGQQKHCSNSDIRERSPPNTNLGMLHHNSHQYTNYPYDNLYTSLYNYNNNNNSHDGQPLNTYHVQCHCACVHVPQERTILHSILTGRGYHCSYSDEINTYQSSIHQPHCQINNGSLSSE